MTRPTPNAGSANDPSADSSEASTESPLLVLRHRRPIWPFVWLIALTVGFGVSIWVILQVRNLLLVQDEAYEKLASSADDAPSTSPAADSGAGSAAAERSSSSAVPSGTEQNPAAGTDAGTAADELPASDELANELPSEVANESGEGAVGGAPADDAAAATTPADAEAEKVPAATTTGGDGAGTRRAQRPAATEPLPKFTAARAGDQWAREEVRQVARSMRLAMSGRQLDNISRNLTSLSQLSLTSSEQLLVERLKVLHLHLQRFWNAAEQGRRELKVGDPLKVGEDVVEVARLSYDEIELKFLDGSTQVRRLGRHDYDPFVMDAIARQRLAREGAHYLLSSAAFWATDSRGNSQQARRVWQQARQQGLAVGDLWWEGLWDQQMSVENRLAVPSKAEIKTAQSQVNADYGRRFATLDQPGRVALAREMLQQADMSTTAAPTKYVLLEQAVKLGVQIGEAEIAFSALDLTLRHFAVPRRPAAYAQVWQSTFGKCADDAARQKALTAALDAASRLVRDAQWDTADLLIVAAEKKLTEYPDGGLSLQLADLRRQIAAEKP